MPLLLFIVFLVVPLAELFIIIRVGSLIGVPETLVVLLAMSVLGAWLVRREGRSAWRRLRETFGRAQVPAVEVVDGALVLIGGTLLLTPGFLTDIVGLLLVVPATRALANRAVRARVRSAFGLPGNPRRQVRRPGGPGPEGRPEPGSSRPSRAGGRRSAEPVDVEVVKVERTRRDTGPHAGR